MKNLLKLIKIMNNPKIRAIIMNKARKNIK